MKLKAIFEIFIIICAIFSVYLVQPVNAQQKACCEKTNSNQYCQYTTVDQCNQNYNIAYTSCEQTSYCKLGCCYNSNEGRCFKNTPRSLCSSQNSTWREDVNCEIAQCSKGCCVLSNECSFVTQTQCKKAATQYGVNMTFKEELKTEKECLDQCRSEEKGCCVHSDNTCNFGTRASCTETSNNSTLVGFHKDTLCSNDALPCECAKQTYTGCLPDKDEVYWFDSCGNPENIYDADESKSYNNGIILQKEQSCTLSKANDPNCGNCNYATNTLCGNAPKDVKMTDGDFSCNDLSCENIYKNDFSPNSGSDKKNGESWCVYDGPVGFAQDLVGSRHYRYLCINGQELTEPCKDFREEICIQGVLGQVPYELEQTFYIKGDFIEAACRINRYQDCSDCKNQKCCENIANRDCFWLKAGITATNGTCVPHVPPGLKFWGDSNIQPLSSSTKTTGQVIDITGYATTNTKKDPKSYTPDADAVTQCEKANKECEVKFERPGIGLLSGGRKWKCVANCQCLEESWVTAAHTLCKAQGDCGAKFNIIGKFTKDGFVEDAPGTPKYDDWNTLVKSSQDKKSKTGISQYLSILAPTLIVAVFSGMFANKFTEGAAVGWKGIGALFESFKNLFSWGAKGFEAGGSSSLLSPWTDISKNIFGSKVISVGQSVNGVQIPAGSTVRMSEDTFYKTVVDSNGNEIFGIEDFTGEGGMVEFKSTETIEGIKGWEAGSKITTTQSTTLGNVLSAVNTLMWIYTIVQILDILLKSEKTEKYTAKCEPWVAPTGGSDCEKCNENGKTCSEYRCKSLGQLCSIINAGTSNELCVNIHPNDVSAPIISAWKDALIKNYTITEQLYQGYKLNQKVKPFTPVTLAIKTNEPSQCKFSLKNSQKYNEMTNYFDSTIYQYNHSMMFSLPSEITTEEALKLTNGGKYQIFVRCQDATGNANEKDYYIQFEVDKGPDLTPPIIEATSIINNGYLSANTTSTNLKIYLNEPAQCSWSQFDAEYEKMTNAFTCVDSGFDVSNIYYGLYQCSTTLTGLTNKDNEFFFRCKDRSNNINSESYKFTLRGSIPLEISSIGPSGNIKESNVTLKVITARGAEDGKAICGYSLQDISFENMVQFLTTNANYHEQPFNLLQEGAYTYYVKCFDIAGNIASTSTTFNVLVDRTGPRLKQLYTQTNILHITLDETSTCKYSNTGTFNYDTQGNPMTNENSLDHEATLDSKVYYITCIDEFNNKNSFIIYP
ncbi:MAG: hypothetical protein V1815_01540 [Candidatus Woesearchaeota archaeon]